MGLTTGSVTAMDRLEKLGYVERRPDPGDRRRVEVRPTAHAFTLAGRLYGPLAEDGTRHLRRYTKPELELLIDVLRRTEALQETHTRRIREMLRDPDPDDQSGPPHGRRPAKGR